MKRILTASLIFTAALAAQAQDSFRDEYDNFLKAAREEYNSFRDQANKEYADFLASPWEHIKPLQLVKPVDKTRPPRPIEEYDHDGKDHSIEYDDIITPEPPKPQPRPIDPIVVKPSPTDKWVSFTYLGNTDRVRVPSGPLYRVNDVSEKGISRSWQELCNGDFDATLADCLELRDKYNLPDWAYLNMLDAVARKVFGHQCSEATLLMAWLYSQSGYTMRLARDNGSELVLMFATDHVIYGSYYPMDGTNYFPFKHSPQSLSISHAAYPNEKVMSLVLTSLPKTATRMSAPRTRTSLKYPSMNCEAKSNENIIEFFNTYPNSQIGDKLMTRWAIYANTPLSREVKDQLYPHFKKVLSGLSERDKVEHLLNWVQTGFIYEYDDKVWGTDRAFFPDETIYYPYADCEDRAILFTRLVRDLVGLDAILVYYPGHLASAIAFNGTESGDYIVLNGRRFTVCDPTFTNGAPVGRTATGYDNSAAKVILLNR